MTSLSGFGRQISAKWVCSCLTCAVESVEKEELSLYLKVLAVGKVGHKMSHSQRSS